MVALKENYVNIYAITKLTVSTYGQNNTMIGRLQKNMNSEAHISNVISSQSIRSLFVKIKQINKETEGSINCKEKLK